MPPLFVNVGLWIQFDLLYRTAGKYSPYVYWFHEHFCYIIRHFCAVDGTLLDYK